MQRRAVLYIAWGEKFVNQAALSAKSRWLDNYDTILITDKNSDTVRVEDHFSKVARVDFKQSGHLRKTELIDILPSGYDSFLLLDSDTQVTEDISLGFEKAEKFGIAVAPAPAYSLDYFMKFDFVMKSENIDCKGQLQYNSGVIFFSVAPEVSAVLSKWKELASNYRDRYRHDQPFFTLAMELLDFNPYTLSISYNYRGFGERISGLVRIWHSHGLPPENINVIKGKMQVRRAWPGKLVYEKKKKSIIKRLMKMIKRILVRL